MPNNLQLYHINQATTWPMVAARTYPSPSKKYDLVRNQQTPSAQGRPYRAAAGKIASSDQLLMALLE